MRVMKFGGTSVATADRLATVVRLVAKAAAETRVVVVASALRGVTDRLVELVAWAEAGPSEPDAWAAGAADDLRNRHYALLDRVASGRRLRRARTSIDDRLAGLARRLHGAALLGACPPAARDAILAIGERLSAPIVAAALQERHLFAVAVDGARLVATDSSFGQARVDSTLTRARAAELMARLPRRAVPVVTGFIGADGEGRTTTLGRGGSDHSASLLAAALGVEQVEIWTDVDAVYTADPRRHPDARPLAELSPDDAEEIAWHGGRVLHRRALEPLSGRSIRLVVRDTLRPDAFGTRVDPESGSRRLATPVVTARKGLLMLRLRKAADRDLARADAALAQAEAEVCYRLQTRPDRMLVLVDAPAPGALVQRLEEAGLQVEASPDVAVAALVGADLDAAWLRALDDAQVRPLGLLAGDRIGSTFVLVAGAQADRAVAALHAAVVSRAPFDAGSDRPRHAALADPQATWSVDLDPMARVE